MRRLWWLVFFVFLLAPVSAWGWPNGPDDDPRADQPNDSGYDGQWNLWSYVPEAWTETEGFREEEIALGTGLHADRAWQVTTGDRRVIVAVLDSGVYWDNKDLVNKYYLNRGELGSCLPNWGDEAQPGLDIFDVDADWRTLDQVSSEILITSLAMLCPFAPPEKQALLEAPALAERARVLTALLEFAGRQSGDPALLQ